MVASPVSELQLVGGGAAGKGNDLMAQADAEDGIFPAQGPDQLNGFFHICRISRPIGKEDAVRPAGGHFFCCGIPGKNSQAASPAQQRPEDIFLHAQINGRDMISGPDVVIVLPVLSADSGYRVGRKFCFSEDLHSFFRRCICVCKQSL